MSRLYDAKVLDENVWKVVEIDDEYYHTYKLINKEKEDIYFFNNIIGFEQVTDDEFLISKRMSRDKFGIVRVKLNNSQMKIIFRKEFSHFNFINDDNILFTYWANSGGYHIDGVYSISKNKELEEAKWLDFKEVDIYKDDKTNEISLLLEEKIASINGNDYLIFTVDGSTLKPNSLCYSSLRDSYIEIKDVEDLKKIEDEDNHYRNIIDDIIFENQRNCIKNAKEKILNKK